MSSTSVLTGKVPALSAVAATKKAHKDLDLLLEKLNTAPKSSITKKRSKGNKKEKKERDPNAPKRPKSAYFFFCDVARPQVKAEQPELKVTEQAKVIAEMWNALSEEEQAPFYKKAADAKEEYIQKKKSYDASQKDHSQNKKEDDEEEDDDDDQ